MKKIFTLFAIMFAMMSLNAKTLYLKTTDAWEEGNAQTAVWYWQGDGTGQWSADMTKINNHIWKVDIDGTFDRAIFMRHEQGKTPDWNSNNWGQTKPADEGGVVEFGSNDMFIISAQVPNTNRWEGSWSVYDSNNNGSDNDDTNGGNSGDDNSGNSGNTGGDKDYFLKGYFNGKNIETPTADEQFENGMLTITFTGKEPDTKGYFFILVCDKGQVIGEQYMASQYTEDGTSCTLVPNGQEKWGIQQGTVTFYLYKDDGDSYTLSIKPIEGRQTVDAVGADVEEVSKSRNTGIRYNLLGTPVDDNYKGIVIVNGKKMLVK